MNNQQLQLPRLNLLVVSSERVNSIDIDKNKVPKVGWVNDMKKRMRLVGEESIVVEKMKMKENAKIKSTFEILPKVVSRYYNKQSEGMKEKINRSLKKDFIEEQKAAKEQQKQQQLISFDSLNHVDQFSNRAERLRKQERYLKYQKNKNEKEIVESLFKGTREQHLKEILRSRQRKYLEQFKTQRLYESQEKYRSSLDSDHKQKYIGKLVPKIAFKLDRYKLETLNNQSSNNL